MKNKKRKSFFLGITLFNLLPCIMLCLYSCSKQDIVKRGQAIETETGSKQIYLLKIEAALRDSMAADDFVTLNFDECYKNEDASSGNYFFRIGFRNKKISVTNTQFQATLNAVQTYSGYDYNIATFNCTDFALEVFNAAGGNLYIPKYQIPGYPNGTTGSNTPQGLYVKLDQMAAAGYTGVQKPGIKGYGDGSHGPCN